MNITTIKEKILTDDDFILSEVEKIHYLYALKREIRWGSERNEAVNTESVAEHIYGMCIVANYFLALEDVESQYNRSLIYDLVTWHDIDEVITGDIIGWKKSAEEVRAEAVAAREVAQNAPKHMQRQILKITDVYEQQGVQESKFVKAIDKLESTIQIFTADGKKIQNRNGALLSDHKRVKDPYLKDFPYMKRFNDVLTAEMVKRDFFVD